MTPRLFDLFKGSDGLWRCFSAKLGCANALIYPGKWEDRAEANQALTEYLREDRSNDTIH
jgi:hypothetical protein